jgi:hypothetical protein
MAKRTIIIKGKVNASSAQATLRSAALFTTEDRSTSDAAMLVVMVLS